MPTQRQQRVGRQILQEISTIVETELADPRLQLVTFTEVRISPDLRNARVFFSCLGGEVERKRAEQGLQHAAGALRRELGRRLSLRFVPELRFEFDDSYERAERIAHLLKRTGGAGSDDA
jgi:ribosome-binding factor A